MARGLLGRRAGKALRWWLQKSFHHLHSQFHFRRLAQQFGDHVRGPRQQRALQQNNVRRKPRDRGIKPLQIFRLRYHAQIIFQRQNLPDADAIIAWRFARIMRVGVAWGATGSVFGLVSTPVGLRARLLTHPC